MFVKQTMRLIALFSSAAFANAGWKLDADGKIEMKDGNPIWIDANGGEGVLNGDTINRLNGEAKKLRERAEAAENNLKSFDGLDPSKAREAIDKLKDIDTSKLIDSGKLDAAKEEIRKEYEVKLSEERKAREKVEAAYDGERVNNLFAGSDFIKDRIAVPRDMFEATFRQNFKIEDGKIVAYGRDGNRIMSKKNIGDYADASEALELLVEMHPQKDTILRADVGNGSGSNGGSGGRGTGRVLKRADFDKMEPMAKAEAAAKMGKGEIQIVD